VQTSRSSLSHFAYRAWPSSVFRTVLVAVNDEEALAVGFGVDRFPGYPDVTEDRAAVIPKKLVVISGHVNDFSSALGLSQNSADDIVVGLRPEQPSLHLQDINDVADEIEEVAFNRTQEVEQAIGATASKSQMDVGNPDGADSWNHFRKTPETTANSVNDKSRTLHMVGGLCDKEMNVLVKKCEDRVVAW
jgi:hypothetical protein